MEKTKIELLAEEILQKAKNDLSYNIHSLIRAISLLEFKATNDEDIFTDAKSFYYNPHYVLTRFKENQNSVTRVLLHSLLHCMLLHPFNIDFKDTSLWNLATDICVENTINSWGVKVASHEKAVAQNAVIEDLKKEVKNLSAENIYYYLKGTALSEETLKIYKDLFKDDAHKIWYKNKNFAFFEIEDEEETVEARSIYKMADNRQGLSNESKSENKKDSINDKAQEEKDEWRKVTPNITSDIEALKKRGLMPNAEVQVLKSVNRDTYDYSKFLKRLVMLNEAIEINDDEFDYIFYDYGLRLYENMPIIEPLEYVEALKIKKLFIAIDTSGSVKGEVVEKFVEKTYNILRSTDFFSTKTEIHIIQCDSQIQDIKVLYNEKEIEDYIKNIKLKGFGGTDFTPVFQYVDEVLASSQKNEITGLIYFTDGDGVYPKKMPSYKSVFVINDTCFDKSKMPLWAISIFVDNDF